MEPIEIGAKTLIRILTKSPVVTRDIDLLSSLPRAEVGMTVTSTDDKGSRWLEVHAPLATRRLRTLAELNDAGITTYAFVGPLLPHFATQPELLDDLFGRLAAARGERGVHGTHQPQPLHPRAHGPGRPPRRQRRPAAKARILDLTAPGTGAGQAAMSAPGSGGADGADGAAGAAPRTATNSPNRGPPQPPRKPSKDIDNHRDDHLPAGSEGPRRIGYG
jgi:hypothetical protein